MQTSKAPPHIVNLPAELIDHILSFVSVRDLVSVSRTCSLFHQHSLTDTLWQPHVNAQLPHPLATPAPYNSFRDLYTAHHPYWLLTRNQLWFADIAHTGKLLLARYSPQRQCIEAYSLNAQRGQHTFQFWEHDSEVIIHTFHPTVTLDLNQPVVRLDAAAYEAARAARTQAAQRGGQQQRLSKLQAEIPMATYAPSRSASSGAALYSQFMLTRPIPDFLVRQNTQVWPPLKVPSPGNERTRNESVQLYSGLSHKPEVLEEASTTSFRLRRWMEFSPRARDSLRMMVSEGGGIRVLSPFGLLSDARASVGLSLRSSFTGDESGGVNLRVGEEVTTYATLDKRAYTPTKEKPWRGIWVGDYSGHGCEFLVILQPDEGELKERLIPVGATQLIEEIVERDRLRAGGNLPHELLDGMDWGSEDDDETGDEDDDSEDSLPLHPVPGAYTTDEETDEDSDDQDSVPGSSTNNTNAPLPSDSAYHLGFSTTHIDDDDDDDESDMVEVLSAPQHNGLPTHLTQAEQSEPDADVEQTAKYQGRIEAIKLTGDPNIPRGEYTFIAPDIGPKGLIRIADEEIFRGARIVRSVGHIAGGGYREDGYTPSQLILVSNDVLAQYWEAFGHISFYKRVDFDQFLKTD